MAMVSDPTGGHDRIVAAHAASRLRGRRGVAGAPIWHQVTTRDFAATLDFYRAVFGWQTQVEADSDEFRYSTVLFDGEQRIGVMDGSAFHGRRRAVQLVLLPGRRRRRQGPAAAHRRQRCSITRAAEDTLYGRLASVADPTGAGFNLSSLQP